MSKPSLVKQSLLLAALLLPACFATAVSYTHLTLPTIYSV